MFSALASSRLRPRLYFCCTIIAAGFGGSTQHGFSGKPRFRKLWHYQPSSCSSGGWFWSVAKHLGQSHLTSHSSRRCFATRLNSGVRRGGTKPSGGFGFGSFPVPPGHGFGRTALQGSPGKPRPAVCGKLSKRRQCWGARLRHQTVLATHCLTSHPSRRCFATRLNSGVRPDRGKHAASRSV